MTDKYLQSFLCFSLIANIRVFFSNKDFGTAPLSHGKHCKTEYSLKFTPFMEFWKHFIWMDVA